MREILNNYLEKFDHFDVLVLNKDLRIIFASSQLKNDLQTLFNANKGDILIEKVPHLNKKEYIDNFYSALSGNPQIIEAEDNVAGIQLKFNALLFPLNIFNETFIIVFLKRYNVLRELDLNTFLDIFYNLNKFILIDDRELINSNYQNLLLHLCNYFADLLTAKIIIFIYEIKDNYIILSNHTELLQMHIITKDSFFQFLNNIKIENIKLNDDSIKLLLNQIIISNKIDEIKNTVSFLHYYDDNLKSILIGINYNNNISEKNFKILNTVFNIYSDLLERKINRILLKEKNYEYEVIKKRYENLFENMLDAFALHKIIVDEYNNPIDYEFIDVNPAFCHMLNILREDIISKTVLQLWPTTEKYWIENYGKVALTGESIQFENYSSTFNKYFRVHAFCPEIGYFAVIFHDITEIVLKQKELELAKEKAEEKEQLKTDFINNLSHELRTPLNGIIGFLDLINDSDITIEEVRKYFHIINNSSHKLLNIVDNILNISQIQCNQIETAITSCKLNLILKEIFYIYDEIKPANINLKLSMPLSDEFSEFHCDSYKIKQIIKQLVDNAVKFTLEGEVEFGYKLNGDNVIFYCKDTGIGIDEKDFELIFRPYVQLEKGLTRHYGGNGLGLSIVAEYLKALNYKYKLTSDIGKGTYFEFYIPKTSFKLYSKITQLNIDNNNKPKILIADDEILNYEHLKIILSKQFNVEIFHAINGQIAIDIWNVNKDISLIFMDIKMPVMDGFTATQKLRELGCTVPIVGLTAYATSKTEFLSKESGFNDILFKPYNKNLLFDTVKKYLNI